MTLNLISVSVYSVNNIHWASVYFGIRYAVLKSWPYNLFYNVAWTHWGHLWMRCWLLTPSSSRKEATIQVGGGGNPYPVNWERRLSFSGVFQKRVRRSLSHVSVPRPSYLQTWLLWIWDVEHQLVVETLRVNHLYLNIWEATVMHHSRRSVSCKMKNLCFCEFK